MTAVKEQQDVYFAEFSRLERHRAGREPKWLADIRKSAIERFGELGFSTAKNEEWRFTSIAKLAHTEFVPAPDGDGSAEREEVARAILARLQRWGLPGEADCYKLFFINGRYFSGWGAPVALPAGARVGSLASALGASGESSAAEAHIARYASYQDHAFAALNTALFEDGALVEIRPNTILEKPVALVFVSTAAAEPHMVFPRNLIVAGAGAQASFIEAHVGLAAVPYLNDAVTEIVAGPNAVLDYALVQDEGADGYHVGILQVEQARASSVTTHTISLGASLDREEVRAVLNGEGAEALLHGLYVISGHQHVDNHTLIDHAKPHCASREVYKGVLDGQASGVFNGKIAVRKDAQKTDSKQSNKNLLLSEGARINTKPQLEIYADDVKCTHGATIGQIDQEAVFYMRSRGIGREEARNLLIQAFANDILDRIAFEPLRKALQKSLMARLAGKRESEDRSPEREECRISTLQEIG